MQETEVGSTLKPVTFDGTGWEYFQVWIVNIALSIVTLGIYSAWAKVRTQQYFYGNTKVLNQSFQYLATGGQLFKSRVIAVIIFLIYQVIATALPIVGLILALAFIGFVPWLVNAGLRFTARVSSWRNVRFDFQGTYREAAMVTLVWPLLGIITLGILMPLAVQRSARYVVNGHRYGQERFEFTAIPRDYYAVIWGLALVYVALIAGMVFSFMATNFILIGLIYLAFYLVAFSVKPLLFNVYWRKVEIKSNGFQADMSVPKFVWVFLSNSVVVLFTLGLMYPWSQVRMAKFTAQSLMFKDAGNVDEIAAAALTHSNAFGEELGEVFDVDVGFGV